jgi:O-antigen ligase
VVVGGGGSPAPIPEIILQCLAALALAAWIVLPKAEAPLFPVDRSVWTIALMTVILPIIQLVPLPPIIWHALSGREVEQAALALVGAQNNWQPWSMMPTRTFTSLLAILPALVMLVMAASLPRGGRALLVAVVTTMAAMSLIVGAGQMAGGEGNPFRFYVADTGFLNGFQANHNSTADILLIAMVGVATTAREYAEYRPRTRLTPAWRLGLVAASCALLSIGVFLTASRMGVALLPVAWLGVLWVVWPLLRFSRKGLAGLGLATLIALIAGLWLAAHNNVIGKVLGRFDFAGEYRLDIWRDTRYAIGQYFPWGTGMGSFVPVFQGAERLEAVGQTIPNRAHNDFLELLLEGGVFGAMLLAAITWTIGQAARKAINRAPAGSRGQVIFAITSLAVIALHSQVDYPLRSMSLAFIAAICVALLMPVPGASLGIRAAGDELRGNDV